MAGCHKAATDQHEPMPWPLEPPADVVELFAREREVLLEFLRSLHTDDWTRPSPCPGWSVLGLAAHLVGDDLSLLARHRDGHHGTVPPEGASDDDFIVWLDELQMEWVHAARRLSPQLVVQLLDWAGPQLVDTMRSRDPMELSADVSWAGPEPAPVWLDQLRELSEYWIHRQQLRWAVGVETDLDAALGAILDAFRWAYPYRLRGLGAPGDTVMIELEGDVMARWILVASATGWNFAEEPTSRIVATMRFDGDQAWRLLTNNLPPDQHGAIDVSGTEPIVRALRRTRAIIGAPNG
jgi:uncharacterized protein (TIGR03083 family)